MENKESQQNQQRRREAERESQIREAAAKHKEAGPPPNISPMEAVTYGAYGGGIYGTEKGHPPQKPPASDTQSADGPLEFAELKLNHTPPPSTGDTDIDITGQSYIQ